MFAFGNENLKSREIIGFRELSASFHRSLALQIQIEVSRKASNAAGSVSLLEVNCLKNRSDWDEGRRLKGFPTSGMSFMTLSGLQSLSEGVRSGAMR